MGEEYARRSSIDPSFRYLLDPRLQRLLDPGLQYLQIPGGDAPIPMDAFREGDGLVLLFDVPGVDASAIEVSVADRVLTVSAVQAIPQSEEGAEILVSERFHGLRSRSVFVGNDLDTEQISATYTNGLLRVIIPAGEPSPGHWVEVSTESGPESSHPSISAGGTKISEREGKLQHNRQTAPNVALVTQKLLKRTFPKAAAADIRRATTVMTEAVIRDVEAEKVDIADAQSTARELADILGRGSPK